MLFLELRRSLRVLVSVLAAVATAGCHHGGGAPTDAGADRRDTGADRRDTGARDTTLPPADAGDTGPAADAAVDGTRADAGAGCTLPPVGADLNRDFDVHLASVSGTLTLAGAPLPDSPLLATRGNVVLRERASGDVRTIPVAATGAGSFAATVFAGSYDVTFESSASAALVGLPIAARTRLASAVTVTGGARLDYDLRLAATSGTITVGGLALPDSPTLSTRGNLVFRERVSGDARFFPVGATGAGTFAGGLFPGSYDVTFETVANAALVGLPPGAEIRVAAGINIAAPGATTPPPLSFDVQVAMVSGTLTAGGAPLPDSPALTSRGNVILRESQSGDVRTLVVPATGAATYAGLMFAGTYDVSFQTAGAAAQLVGLPAASTTRLASALAIGAGSAMPTYDLSIATVSGVITSGGAPLPDSPAVTSRGGVRFVERASGQISTFAVGNTGDAQFTGTLFAGNYDVAFVSSSDAQLVGLPPGGSKRVASALAINGAATPRYDVPVAMVSGTITSGGVALPSSPTLASRGNVVFRDRDTGAAVSLPVGASGAGAFAGLLFASSYDVNFETVTSADLLGLPAGAETRLASNVAISAPAPAPLTWDAPVIAIAGRVTVDGAAPSDSPGLATRGNVVFRDKLTGDARALALPATGPATFSGMAFAGSFDATLETAAGATLVGLPAAGETALDIGCLPAAACAASPADLSGNWTFIFRDQVSWIRWNVTLDQQGATLGGRFTAASGYAGVFDTGTRDGDTIALRSMQNTSTCVLRVDATLSGGCFMTGTGACASGVSQSAFVGVR